MPSTRRATARGIRMSGRSRCPVRCEAAPAVVDTFRDPGRGTNALGATFPRPRRPPPVTGAALMDALTAYLEQHRDRFVDDLKTALRIPSVSAKAEHKADCARCAAFL